MQDPNEAYRAEFTRSLAGLIAETGRAPGARATLINADIIVDELVSAIAFVIHNSPDVKTPSATRETCDKLARVLQRRIGLVKAKADAGELPFFRTPENGVPN